MKWELKTETGGASDEQIKEFFAHFDPTINEHNVVILEEFLMSRLNKRIKHSTHRKT